MAELSKGYWNDYRWANKNMSELVKKYANKWIAIVNKKVIAFGPDVETVELKAKNKVKQKEFPILFVERGIHVYKD